jgi:hypothetical protein
MDPLTYLTLGASAEGQAIAKGIQRTGKALSTGERLARSAKLGGRLFGRKGIGGVNVAGRAVVPFPAISEAAHAAKIPKAVDKIAGLPGVDELGRALKPFWRMTGLQKKKGRLYLWGKEMKKRDFDQLLLKRAEELGLTEEQVKLATHSIQYHELLEGDDPIKALDNALVKWAEEGENLQIEESRLKKLLEEGSTEAQEAQWKGELEDIAQKSDTHIGLFEAPEVEIRQLAEQLATQSPEDLAKIRKASYFGQEQFAKMIEREQLAGLPIQARERYVPGMYPEELPTGLSPQKSKKFASLLEAKAAGWEPEENMWKLLAKRGHKAISASETRLFTDDMIRKFGTRLVPDESGKLTLKEGEKIWVQRDALRNMPASDLRDWIYRRIDELKANNDMVEIKLRADDLHKFSQISKDTPFFSLPEPLVNWMNTYEKRIQREHLRTFAKWNSKFMNYFRAYATMPRPAFHLRNAIDNYFRLFLDLGPDALNPKWNAIATKVLKENSKGSIKLGGKTYSFAEVRRLMEKHGLRRHGWIGADIWDKDFSDMPRAMDRMFSSGGKKMARAMNPLDVQDFFMLRAGRYLGEHIEDHAHAVSFMKNLDKMGDPYKAAERAHKFLIDYRELTPFERRVGKGVFPFYTFFRKNIPLQAEQILKQPGKYALIPKGKRFVEGLSEEPDYDPPEYYEKAFAVRLPIVRRVKGKDGKIKEMQQYANLNMSFQEINQISSLSDIIARMHPGLKAGFELFAEKEAFSDIPGSLAEGKMVTAPGTVAAFPKILRQQLGIRKIRARGEERWVMPAKVRYVVNSLNPYAAELGKIALPPGLEREGWDIDLRRWATGAMMSELDPEKQRRFNRYKQREDRRKLMRQLRLERQTID